LITRVDVNSPIMRSGGSMAPSSEYSRIDDAHHATIVLDGSDAAKLPYQCQARATSFSLLLPVSTYSMTHFCLVSLHHRFSHKLFISLKAHLPSSFRMHSLLAKRDGKGLQVCTSCRSFKGRHQSQPPMRPSHF
jgi:hypothetical protein